MRLQHIANTDLCPAGLEAEEIRTNFCPYYIAYLCFLFPLLDLRDIASRWEGGGTKQLPLFF